MTRFGEILSHYADILKDVDNFLRAYLQFDKVLDLLWQKVYAIGPSFIVVSGHNR